MVARGVAGAAGAVVPGRGNNFECSIDIIATGYAEKRAKAKQTPGRRASFASEHNPDEHQPRAHVAVAARLDAPAADRDTTTARSHALVGSGERARRRPGRCASMRRLWPEAPATQASHRALRRAGWHRSPRFNAPAGSGKRAGGP